MKTLPFENNGFGVAGKDAVMGIGATSSGILPLGEVSATGRTDDTVLCTEAESESVAELAAIHAAIDGYKASVGCAVATEEILFSVYEIGDTLLDAFTSVEAAAYAMVTEVLNDELKLARLLGVDEDDLAEMSHDEKLLAIFSVDRYEAFGICGVRSIKGDTYWIAAAVPGADLLWVNSVKNVMVAQDWMEPEMYDNYDAETGEFNYAIYPAR
jgi:hypothetical protein